MKYKVVNYVILPVILTLRRLLRALPPTLVIKLGEKLGYIASFFAPRELEIARTQLLFALRDTTFHNCSTPGELHRAATVLARKNFSHFGRFFAETCLIPELLARDAEMPNIFESYKHIAYTGFEPMRERIHNGQSAIVLSGHIGCFELLAAFHVALGGKISVIGRMPNHKSLGVALDRLRSDYGAETIWREDKRSAAKIINGIKNGHIICFLIDQDTHLESAFSPFFGLPAASPIAPINLAIRYGLPVLSCFIVRTGNFSHRTFTAAIPYQADDPNAADKILAVYNQHLEALILQYPEQWVWWHRRWRREPDIDYRKEPSRLRSTREYLNWLQQQSNTKYGQPEQIETALYV